MRKGVESLGRVRAQGIVLLLVTFAVGALAGVAFERVRAARRTPESPGAEARRMPPWRPGMLPGMFEQLDLTQEQRARILDIMERSRPRTETMMQEMLPRLRAVTDSVRAEIRAVLTPEQGAKLDRLERAFRQRGRGWSPGMRGRGMGGPPQPPER
jgi:Spy/CpxP family protein refolding chaperone